MLFINSNTAHFNAYLAAGDNSVSIMYYLGIPVDYVYLNYPGQVASMLASKAYSQIWHYDLNSNPPIGDFSPDYDAIANWYANHPTRHIIVDARYLGSHWGPPAGTPISLPGFAPSLSSSQFGAVPPFWDEGLYVVKNFYQNMRRGGWRTRSSD